jgi:hypothetical protein
MGNALALVCPVAAPCRARQPNSTVLHEYLCVYVRIRCSEILQPTKLVSIDILSIPLLQDWFLEIYLIHTLGPSFDPFATTYFLILLLFPFRNAAIQDIAALIQIEAKEEGHADALIATNISCAMHRTHIPCIRPVS